ncbi:restriction endonuclease subunit S [Lentibacillus amyloliquefaciens]|uniref:Type I restriction modification DNA specificity domain-containing protein n=1 Tax=Lentibacillus amyloliquefaciens TaxID=1472767 RepID=A0A0U4ED77_9BACI|nr:restriction endonuclease subunit S [Lentibacillus amyloliquefaciens]ALX48521.1 hypothetical protein AOX59_07810 [Lentibacillus amyloliquefaciens]
MSKKQNKTVEELLDEALVSEEEQPYEVPENWIWVSVGTLNNIVTGSTPSKKKKEYYGGNFPFIKPTELDDEKNAKGASEYLTNEGKEASKVIPSESTLICCIGSIGKAAFNNFECSTNQQINSLVPRKKIINPLFNYYQAITPYFQSELNNRSYATTVSIINKSKMSLVPIPLPPLSEQKRIANKVERLLDNVDKAKQLIEEAKGTFELRRAAIIKKGFKGELTAQNQNNNYVNQSIISQPFVGNTLPPGWTWKPLSDLVDEVKEKYDPQANDIKPYIGLEHLSKGGGIITTSNSEGIKSAKKAFKDGDLLYGRLRPYLNKHAIVSFDGICSTDILVLRPNGEMENELLNYYIGLPEVVKYSSENSSGVNLPRVSSKELLKLIVPVPPKEEQLILKKILERMLNNLTVAEKTTNIIEKIDKIKHSILSKAFRGELGTHDPTEENAMDLLKEVLTEDQPNK